MNAKSLKRYGAALIIATALGFGSDLCAQTQNDSMTNVQHRKRDMHRDDHRRDDHRRDDHRREHVKLFPLQDEKFAIITDKVKDASFKDCKLALIEVSCIDNYFVCRQVLSLLKLFTFDDDKLEVLKIMSPYILDKENYEMLSEHFTFDKNKKSAMDLLKK
jgi:Ni/Co efflux regulator RcnB